MPVYWTIQARRHLRQALAEELVSDPGVVERMRGFLDAMLNDAFKGAAVVVKDQVIGYRRKKQQFTLLIEAFGTEMSDESGPFVVKIGAKDKLGTEILGWEACRPPGLKHDLVFLGLVNRATRAFEDGEPWICLVYGDAQQFLGVSYTLTFEEAAMECVRSGFPKLGSVVFVVNELYERIGHLLYSQSFVQGSGALGFALELPRLDECLKKWEDDGPCLIARRDVNSLMIPGGVEKFIDPVDYLRYVQKHVRHVVGEDSRRDRVIKPDVRPTVVDVVPRMLRGCSHGDLHGRNILVGIVRDQAMWPTVFDYEDMTPGNLIGWDFVKLETELKIRAYADMFSGRPIAPFAKEVQAAEIALAKRTEDCHLNNQPWPEPGASADKATPLDRLATIVMAVRRMAAQHLGANHGRPNEWLEEYYFLLAAYGTFTGRFENLSHRERMAALISAGVAASRLNWPRVEMLDPKAMSIDEVVNTPFPSYHKPYELAKTLGRSGEKTKWEESLKILDNLAEIGRYPHILAIGQERVFVLMEQGLQDEAEEALRALEKQFLNLDEEFLSRWGRLFKDKGDSQPLNLAEPFYRKSLEKYDQAYRIREGHYPGINKATLLLILGCLRKREPNAPPADEWKDSEDLARKLLDPRTKWHVDHPDDETVWFPATRGEAHLLLRNWEKADAQYREALKQKKLAIHSRETMRSQVERIVGCFKGLGETIHPPFNDLDTLFGVNPDAPG